jgi:radical SAM protein with 4Fe4S-binding SPASM domain
MSFAVLSNLTILTDEMIEWMLKNNIGIQVSLDDLQNSKPLNNGESSSPIVLKNIERLKEAKASFSINTVFSHENTKSLKDLVDYVCSIGPLQWGFSASFTLNDDTYIEETMNTIKLGILRLRDNGFDVRSKFRFYNEVINYPGHTCSAGVNIFAIGTDLEIWPCQSMIDQNPLGYFDENFKTLLATCYDNKYFRDRTLLSRCADCSVLNWCRGGCRAVHPTDMKAVEITCKIKQEIIPFIQRETDMRKRQYGHSTNFQIDRYIERYVAEKISEPEPQFVETPPLPEEFMSAESG